MAQEDCFHLGAKALIHNESGQLLLLQLNPNKSRNTREARWDIPGGRIQKGEHLETALKREVLEETGIATLLDIRPFMMVLTNLRIVAPTGADVGLIFATYLCTIPKDSNIQVSDEHIQFQWVNLNKAFELLSHYPKELLEKLSTLQEVLL